MLSRKIFPLLCILALWAALAPAQAPDRQIGVAPKNGDRVALVIGNGAYLSSPLNNPPNDARAMSAVLRACGFTVIEKINADLKAMEEAVGEFGRQIPKQDCALFFYAGHGLQVRGQNYLVPTDAKVDAENLVKYECMNAGQVLARMKNAGCRVNIVILDACRNNPFARSWRATNDGLAQMDAARGSLIAYATAPGSVASDGPGSKNSYYTESLLKHMRTPGLPVERVFKRVRSDVLASTGNVQVPWENSSLVGDFYFIPKGGDLVQPAATPIPFEVPARPVATPRPAVGSSGPSNTQARLAYDELLSALEKRDFGTEKKIAYLQDFVKDYKGTTAAVEAQKRMGVLENLAALLVEAKSNYKTLSNREAKACLTQSEADQRARLWGDYVSRYGDTGWQIEAARKKARNYKTWKPGPSHGDVERFDLGGGVTLEMVYIEGGSFEMGSPSSESGRDDDEGPVHPVELDGFWMGKFEVTQAQYQAIMGSNPSRFSGSRNPVEQVSWNNAKDFCERLSRKTGKTFRLPTEAEWEYACRAGSRTRYCFGDSESQLKEYANYEDTPRYGDKSTAPVGSFKPNAWGLYDMHGNVWEWCLDWYGDYSSGRQKNPTGKSSGSDRVFRGGSWGNGARYCRSANRNRGDPADTDDDLGFRVVASPIPSNL